MVKSPFLEGRAAFTLREKEVLEMLVDGRSNKESWGIGVRAFTAHVAKLMSKVGVRSRIALSTYVIAHSLISSGQD